MLHFRKLILLPLVLVFCFTTVACGDPLLMGANQASYPRTSSSNRPQARLPQGQYPVQQVTYDDGDGEYTVTLLDVPGGASIYRTTNLPMARLTDAEIQNGQRSYLKVEADQPSLHLTEDFKIDYVHNVTQTQTNPATGQPETVVVRQQNGFWAPFAGAIAGQAVGSLLFRPQYYVPPVYQPGVVLRGYGGYGSTYGQAVNQYQSRYQSLPPAVRNAPTLRTTGRLRSPSTTVPRAAQRIPGASRSTGSGYGSSTLRQRGSSYRTPSRGSFGSGRSSSFGGSRRRR